MTILPLGESQPLKVVLPTLSLGLEEIFVTDAHFKDAPRLGDFMPVLEVTLVRSGVKHPPAVFSLS